MKIEDLPSYTRGAAISADGKYRYFLERRWLGAPTNFILGFIMLNPSTADAFTDDPTIRRCVGFARGFGFAGIDVCNLYAYRASRPGHLPRDLDEAIGPLRDHYLKRMSRIGGNRIVVAWGASAPKGISDDFTSRALKLIRKPAPGNGYKICCFGLTKDLYPKHPLYLPASASLEHYA